jgi:Smg protein
MNCFQEVDLDERMMTLFSLIADQVRKKQELFDEEGKIMQALLNNGCRLHEADAALTFVQMLVQRQSEDYLSTARTASPRMRTMNREERDRFTVDAFGFVTKLTNLGIIGEDQREELLERAMTVCTERIELDHIKALVTLMLFVHPHEQDVNIPLVRRMRKTSWN